MRNIKEKIIRLSAYLIITVSMILISETVFNIYYNSEEKESLKNLFIATNLFSQKIQQNILTSLSTLDAMHAMIIVTDYDTDKFQNWSEVMLSTSPYLSSVQLAPNGIVSFIYPLEGNEKAMGHNLILDQSRNSGALSTIKNRSTTIIGPINLLQNGKKALIARKPIFKEEVFWGFCTIIINMEAIMIPELTMLKGKHILYRITGDDPDSTNKPIIETNDENNKIWVTSYNISLPNTQWSLELNYDEHYYDYMDEIHIIAHLISFLIALLACFQQYRIFEKNYEIKINEKNRTIAAMGITTNHELNQPLTVIKGYVELLKQKDESEENLIYYSKIEVALDRIEKTLKQFREFDNVQIKKYLWEHDMIVFDDD
ncbi:MAG: CHASE domain-containing protein [Candidatus Delongbacteria bacterium]|nr:CHASE domain-containing protein [Candidatus Delongbacteria bacterium]MBN2834929.1 CHASE domain-containing protein [Candidatus Delongbacteria bacterium]